MNASAGFIRNFREAAPYIRYLRGKTLVVGISSSLLSGAAMAALAADLNLMAGLGVRLVIVHGARTQINGLSEAAGIVPQYHNGRRITDETVLACAKQACGMVRSDLEAALSFGLSQTPLRGRLPNIAGGNFVSARPLGVIDGIDMGYTGVVRKVNTDGIRRCLDDGAVVLISPLAHSLSGKTFNLSMADIAESTAIALEAEKLVYMVEQDGILDAQGRLLPNVSADEARSLLASDGVLPAQRRLLQSAVNAVENGVQRTQILSGLHNGSLIAELFTRYGVGTSLARNAFMNIRGAESRDIPDIAALVRPLEEQGILLRRSREYLETHIGAFSVLEHDCRIYGCVALKTFAEPDAGELACLAVSPEARDGGYGELLLEHLLQQARHRGIRRLFALSTHTGEWFLERGFQTASPEELPPERLEEYRRSRRQSKVFVYAVS